MPECRLIQTRSGEALHLRYWSDGSQWRRSGAMVPSGTVGLALEEQDGPFDLDSGQSVPAFVRMEWPDPSQANKVASGWVASNFTTIVNCPRQIVSQTQEEGALYFDPADDPYDRPLKDESSFIPLLAVLALGYFALFR